MLRVAASYAVIAWLVLQIADVTLAPMGAPAWTMRALITLALIGAPIAIALAWFFEITPAGVAADTAPAGEARPAAAGWRRHADIAIIAVLLAIVAILLLREAGWLKPGPRFAAATVAVLPFANPSGESNAYLSAGLEDELRGHLGRVQNLTVIGSSSSHAAHERRLAATETADLLGVAALVEGTVRRDGNRLRVSVQLVDGRDGSVAWSQAFDRSTADLLDVQAAIAAEIVRSLMPQFLEQGGTVPGPGTANVTAQDLYLLGRNYERQGEPADLQKARELFESAIAADPRYAAAHASLGRVIAFQNHSMAMLQPDALDALVLPHADRVLSLDRLNAEAYLVKGFLRRWSRRSGGETFYRLAAEADPNLGIARQTLAAFEFSEAGFDLATEHVRRAVKLDPMLPGAHAMLVRGLAVLGRRDEMQAAAARAAEVLPADERALALPCQARLDAAEPGPALACVEAGLRTRPGVGTLLEVGASACATLNDRACELRYLQQMTDAGDHTAAIWLGALRDDPKPLDVYRASGLSEAEATAFVEPALVAMAFVHAGRLEDALWVYRTAGIVRAVSQEGARSPFALEALPTYIALEKRYGTDDVRELTDIALDWTARFEKHGAQDAHYRVVRVRALAVAGRNDEGLAELERAVTAFGAPFIVEDLQLDPAFASLRDHPRAKALLAKVQRQRESLRANR